VIPYHRSDIVAALGGVTPYNWEGFFYDRLDVVTPTSPHGGFTRGGYRLVYNDQPSKWITFGEARGKTINMTNSLGMVVGEDGKVGDIADGSPAARAGIGYGMTIVAMGGRTFNRDAADGALRATVHDRAPMQVITEDQGNYVIRNIDYHGGPRYPHLVRIAGTPDLLMPIAAPHRKR
jgi:predicted metalloprotease with PDZ domain